MYKSKLVTNCQICKSKKLDSILFLGYLPPVNKFIKVNTRPQQEESYPAELLFCNKCKLVQLGLVVHQKILFPSEYPYTSSTTKILRENFYNLFKKIKKKFNFQSNDLVIDIGSNDGNLLSNFKNDFKVLGITPEKIGKIAIKRGIPTLLKYFNLKTAELIIKKYKKAKIITATNVFAHMDSLDEIIKGVKRCLDKEGVFITESHYLIPLLTEVQYDTVYHEHLRYYSVTSLNKLFVKYGLQIFDVEKIPTHGGSIRVFCGYKNKFKVQKSVNNFLKKEKKYLNYNFFKKFEKKVLSSKLDLLSILSKIKKTNSRIAGVSAPSRAATLINYVGIEKKIIEYIFEIPGSYKIGCYVPGTTIPVVAETKVDLNKFDYLLIFSWHIYKELKLNLRKKGYRGKFIIPLPYPRIMR
jgi:hypothetical protein